MEEVGSAWFVFILRGKFTRLKIAENLRLINARREKCRNLRAAITFPELLSALNESKPDPKSNQRCDDENFLGIFSLNRPRPHEEKQRGASQTSTKKKCCAYVYMITKV